MIQGLQCKHHSSLSGSETASISAPSMEELDTVAYNPAMYWQSTTNNRKQCNVITKLAKKSSSFWYIIAWTKKNKNTTANTTNDSISPDGLSITYEHCCIIHMLSMLGTTLRTLSSWGLSVQLAGIHSGLSHMWDNQTQQPAYTSVQQTEDMWRYTHWANWRPQQ